MLRDLERRELRTPAKKSSNGKVGFYLDNEDRLFILWAWSNQWTPPKTAQHIPCSPDTVRAYKKQVVLDPKIVFDLRVLVQLGPRSYRCQFCGAIRSTRTRCMRHILAHLLPVGWAKTVPLDDFETL